MSPILKKRLRLAMLSLIIVGVASGAVVSVNRRKLIKEADIERSRLVAAESFKAMEYEKAVQNYTEYLSLSANDTTARLNLARSYYHAGEATPDGNKKQELLNKAEATYRDLIVLNPYYIKAYLDLAQFYYAIGRRGDAMSVVQQGLTANPGSSELERLDRIIKGSS